MVPKIYCLLIFVVFCKGIDVDSLKLKQVLILSRHNVRYTIPTSNELQRYSPKPWPKRSGQAGNLTPRGAQLEGYMGEYFSEWFKKEQFFSEECPGKDVYVYSNTRQRTVATARAFVDSAFKDCQVPVHHKDTEESDPLFAPVIHNYTESFKNMVFEEIKKKMNNNLKLKTAYSKLNKILNIKDSDICKQDSICDLTDATKNSIFYEVGKELWVYGPLFIAIQVMDLFIMSYYDGAPIESIAWGQITTPEEWELVTELMRQDQNIRYRTVAEDIGAPLVEHLTKVFKNYTDKPKLMLLVGHDYNLNSVSSSLGFKSFHLPDQYEEFPIGGRIVFQRWTDGENDYVKIEYIYPTWSQIRQAKKLSLENPPGRVLLQLNWCSTDEHGFCSWDEFVQKL